MSNDDFHVSFNNVQKSYDGVELVVKDLNLDIEKGKFVTLLGPSGSGKTTSLMMLAGFESVTQGEIVFNGRPINRIPPHKRGIGIVFQNYALFPHMTVGENLAFPLEVRSMSKADTYQKVKDALEMVQMADFMDRYPGQLSGGQKQRVALSRALVFNPELVLMDEPLGALDKQLREQMQYEIKHIQERLGVTVVYVTHDQSEALTMSDDIAVFHNGVIQQLASPADLYERPQNSFIAQFIGENNQLGGTIGEVENDIAEVTLEDGSKISALEVNTEGAGSKALLSIRPERVVINPDKNQVSNSIEGQVRELIYLGDHVRCRMSVAGNDEFIVKVPNASDHQQLAVDEKLHVGWMAQDCRALNPL